MCCGSRMALTWGPPSFLNTEVTASVLYKGGRLSSKYFSIFGAPGHRAPGVVLQSAQRLANASQRRRKGRRSGSRTHRLFQRNLVEKQGRHDVGSNDEVMVRVTSTDTR